MDPISIVAICAAIIAALSFGGGVGVGLSVNKGGAATIEAVADLQIANGQAFDDITSHIDTLAESEAHVADVLTQDPAPCQPALGGDVTSPECLWALCMRTGETEKQRCMKMDVLTDLIVRRWETEPVACVDDIEDPEPPAEP